VGDSTTHPNLYTKRPLLTKFRYNSKL